MDFLVCFMCLNCCTFLLLSCHYKVFKTCFFPTSVAIVTQTATSCTLNGKLSLLCLCAFRSQFQCFHMVFLQVYGGSDSSSPSLVTLCHQQSHPITVTSQGNRAFISFDSDQSVRGKGFNISYTTLHDGWFSLLSMPDLLFASLHV